jgi:site-specific DNA-methyltransferase (adenine-specific)
MEWLVGLVCPPHGTVLDPFSGSGSTLVAATNLGFSSVGFEVHPDYFKIAQARTQQALSIRLESENAAQGYDALLDTP